RDKARWLLKVVATESEAWDRADQFERLSEEAISLVYREFVAGPDPGGPGSAARVARAALASFPDLKHLPADVGEALRLSRLHLLYVMPEAASRDGDGDRPFRAALHLLDRADDQAREDGVALRAAFVRRARYLDRLGRRDEADEERRRAAQIQQPAG